MSYVLNPSDGGDEYSLKAGAKTGSSVPIQLDAAVGADTEVKLTEGSNITLTQVASDEISIAASGGGSPGGSDTQVQFNDGGSFGGDADFTFTKTAGAEQVKISASSSSELLKITQTGTGDALLIEDSASPDNTPFRVGNTGSVAIGTAVNPSYALRTSTIGNIQFGSNGFITGGRYTSTSNGSASSTRFSRNRS